jgi:hypothetical protein
VRFEQGAEGIGLQQIRSAPIADALPLAQQADPAQIA